jgi:hypothetical protein
LGSFIIQGDDVSRGRSAAQGGTEGTHYTDSAGTQPSKLLAPGTEQKATSVCLTVCSQQQKTKLRHLIMIQSFTSSTIIGNYFSSFSSFKTKMTKAILKKNAHRICRFLPETHSG